MAIPTEKDSVTNELVSPETEINIIVVKLPFDLQDRILSFPFLHLLTEQYPKAILHLITPKKEIEVLNLLPFKAYYHECDESDLKTVFDVHRFCVNSKIYNVDLFVSLTNSLLDGCLGLGFRAKKRLGFSDGWKTLIFNQKIIRPVGHHVTEDYLALLKEHLGREIETKIRVMSRDLTSIVKEWDSQSYIAINVAPLRDNLIDEEWIELMSYFHNQKIILFSSEDQEMFLGLVDGFISRLNKNNSYLTFKYPTWIELGRMLAYSQGVISYSGPLSNFACYAGAKTVILYDREIPQRHGPFYFLSDFIMMGSHDPTLIHNQGPQTSVVQERRNFSMSQVFQKAFDFLKLKEK